MLRFVQKARVDEAAVARLCASKIPKTAATLLVQRGIRTEQAAQDFLHPTLALLHDPFLMPDMQKVVQRIQLAKENKQKVVIYGDYDADGVTATALLLEHLRKMGIDVDYYIPDRHGEGYGLNKTALDRLARQFDLLITVDCGITAIDEVRYAKQLNLDIIITDHHSPLSEIPDALCLNPRLPGYPFHSLAGVGVALKLVQALGGLEAVEECIDIAAIGTVADIVSLTDENRVIVKFGLERAAKHTRPGIKAIMENAGIREGQLLSTHIGYMIGPRINAGGRIGHSAKSVEMLTTKDPSVARQIADTLEEHNQLRQSQEQAIMQEALRQLEADPSMLKNRCIVVWGNDWNPGVVGIVASRLVERYFRPAFVMAKQDGQYVCSARSIKGVNLFEMINRMPELFVRYGGHEMAAGLTIEEKDLFAFIKRINEELDAEDDDAWIPSAEYDLKADLSSLDFDLLHSLKCLEPFGQGNQSPVFLIEGAQVVSAAVMGAGNNHLRMQLSQNGQIMDAAAFKMGSRLGEATGLINATVVPEINSWQGKQTVRLMLRQFAPSVEGFMQAATARMEFSLAAYLILALAKKEPGFKRHLSCTTDDVIRLLRQNLRGTLLLYSTNDSLQAWLELLKEAAVLQRLNLGMGRIKHISDDFNLLCGFGQIDFASMRSFSNIVLLDGILDKGIVDQLLQRCPQAIVFVSGQNDHLKQATQRAWPTVEMTRDVFRQLKGLGSGEISWDLLKARLPLHPASLHVALQLLNDMGLIRYTAMPFSLELLAPDGEKRNFDQAATNIRMRELLL